MTKLAGKTFKRAQWPSRPQSSINTPTHTLPVIHATTRLAKNDFLVNICSSSLIILAKGNSKELFWLFCLQQNKANVTFEKRKEKRNICFWKFLKQVSERLTHISQEGVFCWKLLLDSFEEGCFLAGRISLSLRFINSFHWLRTKCKYLYNTNIQ